MTNPLQVMAGSGHPAAHVCGGDPVVPAIPLKQAPTAPDRDARDKPARGNRKIPRRAWRGRPGFTLVEAVVATLLMAFILGTIATLTAQWLPNWNRGFLRLQRDELLAAGLERLLADLAAAEFVSAGAIEDPPLFEGGEISVTFVRTAIGPNAGTGLEIVRLAEIAEARGPALVRSSAPFLPAGQDAALHEEPRFGNPVVVIRAPYRVTFSYAGADRVWRESWRGAPQLPRAVRVRVRDAATSRTLAVSTSAVVHAELPARCAWARAAGGCPFLTANQGG